MAAWAYDPVVFHSRAASRAVGRFFDRMQKGFFFKGLLIFIFQGSWWSENQIDENAGEEKDSNNQYSEDSK
jgi:hypothetical protein